MITNNTTTIIGTTMLNGFMLGVVDEGEAFSEMGCLFLDCFIVSGDLSLDSTAIGLSKLSK